MRWVVISLLLMNALYFGWRWLQPDVPAETGKEKEIELSPQSVQISAERSLPIVEEEMPAAPAPQLDLPAAESDEEDTALVVSEPPSASESAEPVAEPLISMSAQQQVITSPSLLCYWTDWQDSAPDVKAAEVLERQQQEQETGRSYLVWIPPKDNKEETLERLRELKTMDIESAYINRGEQKGGISLGLFSSEESVQIRLNDAKRLGIDDARTLTRVRTQTMHRALIKQTEPNNENIPENWQKTGCPPIAPVTDAQ